MNAKAEASIFCWLFLLGASGLTPFVPQKEKEKEKEKKKEE
jgi:hypothetical protein